MTTKLDIEKETTYLFDADWYADDFDANDSYEHYNRAMALLEAYPWEEVYPVWKAYAYTKCKTFRELINYCNLYYYYGGIDYVIPDPYEFCSYFMYRFDISDLWDEGGESIEQFVFSILLKCGYIDLWNWKNVNIFEDETLERHIEQRKKYG